MNVFTILTNVAIMTAWSSAITILSVMALSVVEHKSAAAPVTAISHIFYGDSAFEARAGDAMHFGIGFVLNVMAMIGWSAVAELVFRALSIDSHRLGYAVLVAVALSVLAYITDFHIVPKRFTPGFEHILSKRAIYVTYVFLAISFVIGAMMRVG